MPVRIPSDQHETVVSVLREAARVNGDVEPDIGAGRHSLTLAEWDRAADGVAGHLAGFGVAKGDVVCPLLPSSIDCAVLYGGLLHFDHANLAAVARGTDVLSHPGDRRLSPLPFAHVATWPGPGAKSGTP
jgi:acyl-CoA synthetase (AMP-forming)/AMP-acid ligase II